MLPEPLCHDLSPMNPGIVILEHARAIREEKIHWWNNLLIQYIQVADLILWAHTVFFGQAAYQEMHVIV